MSAVRVFSFKPCVLCGFARDALSSCSKILFFAFDLKKCLLYYQQIQQNSKGDKEMKAQVKFWYMALILVVFIAGCPPGKGGDGGDTTAKAITAFSFTSPAATGTIDENAKTIAVTVPNGTDVTALIATYTTTGESVKVGSSLQVCSITANDFTSPVVYMVTAADGTTATYTVTVTAAPSSAKAITAFSFTTPPATGTIDESAKTIAVSVPHGTDVTALIATFTTTGASVQVGSTVQVIGTTANDFTNPVTYTVTAADGSTTAYTVTVTIASGSAKAITAFSLLGVSGVVDESAKTITVALPYGANVTLLVATFTTTGASVQVGSTVQLSGTTANNFTGSVTYTVTAADSTTAIYTVTVTVATSAIKLPKTGQATCYNSAGTVIACATTGQDGELQEGVAWPSTRFATNGDTSITDNLTGLVWAPDGNLMPTRNAGWDTDGTDDGRVTWQHALDYVAKLNTDIYLGHNDWRLPNRKELKSLVNYGQAINATWLNTPTQGFANAQASGYWSSNSYTDFADIAFYVHMSNGYVGTSGKTDSSYPYSVWPVRAGQSAGAPAELPKTGQTICSDSTGTVITCTNTGQDGALQIGVAWPSSRFAANSDTSITDNLTGLVWVPDGNLMPTRDSSFDADGTANDGRVTWQHALDYVAILNSGNYLGHNDWRLPDVNELESLVNSDQSNTATWLITQGFTNAQSDDYWSSTSCTFHTSFAWFVGMFDGEVYYVGGKTAYHYVWPVRGGQ
jgi:hypothetical protein